MPSSIAHAFAGSWGFTTTDYTWLGPNWIVSRAVSALAKSAEGRRPVGLALPATNVDHDSPRTYPYLLRRQAHSAGRVWPALR